MKAKSLCSAIVSVHLTLLTAQSATTPQIAWQQSFGGIFDDWLASLQQTSDGGYILCGPSTSSPSGNKTSPAFGVSDLWVVRLNASGEILWDKSFGGDAQEGLPCAIRQTRDGGFILAAQSRSGVSGNKTTPWIGASPYYDLWVIRLNTSGDKMWETSFGGIHSEYFGAIEETADGGFILGGSSESGVTGNKSSPNWTWSDQASPHQGLLDYWLVRLDANGVKLWDRSFGGWNDDFLYAVRQTADGGFILGGESNSPASGNKTAAGYVAPVARWPTDFWVVRVDRDGNKLWDRSYGGTSLDGLYALTVTTDGGFLFGGYSYSDADGNKSSARFGTIDYWVVRTDAVGEKLWDKAYGSGNIDRLRAMTPTVDGGFVLAGYSDNTYADGRIGNKTSPSFGSADYWIVRIDELGNMLWDLSLGGTRGDAASDIKQTVDGGFLVGGASLSSSDGNKTSLGFGRTDLWIIKLAPEDSDSDGVPNFHDACSDTPVGSAVNSSGCSIEQLCPCDGPWKSHGHYIVCVLRTSAQFLKAGLITHAERRQILKQAIRSECGRRYFSKHLRDVSKLQRRRL